jgi:hypothetical protein
VLACGQQDEGHDLSLLAKLPLKCVTRIVKEDPVLRRRRKLVSALDRQLCVVEARIRGEHYSQVRKRKRVDAQGRQVVEEQHCILRPWFFERDNGWYVQCKFGNRAILLSHSSNAAFADSLEGVAGVLSVLRDAANSGELDLPILLMTKGRA